MSKSNTKTQVKVEAAKAILLSHWAEYLACSVDDGGNNWARSQRETPKTIVEDFVRFLAASDFAAVR
jgi:hypothetical protein